MTAMLRDAEGKVRPLRRRFNPGDLTLAELEDAEERIGLPVDQWPKAPSSARVMRAVGFLILRRDQPDLTWDAMGEVTLGELDAMVDLFGEDAEDPTSGGGGE